MGVVVEPRPALPKAEGPSPQISPARILFAVVGVFAVTFLYVWIITARTSPRPPVETGIPAPRPTPDLHALGLTRILLSDYTWSKGGFGSIALAKFEILNANPYSVKDLVLRCDVKAQSGTSLGSITHTIYEIVKADSTRKLPEANLGLIDSQASSLSCLVVGYSKAE
jgi:hypothetical protein